MWRGLVKKMPRLQFCTLGLKWDCVIHELRKMLMSYKKKKQVMNQASCRYLLSVTGQRRKEQQFPTLLPKVLALVLSWPDSKVEKQGGKMFPNEWWDSSENHRWEWVWGIYVVKIQVQIGICLFWGAVKACHHDTPKLFFGRASVM